VAALGDGVEGWKVGEKVVINSNLSCGVCPECLEGRENRCKDWHLLGETVRGTYAEYVVVPEVNLYALPRDFAPRAAAAAGLVYHTAWHSLVRRANLHSGESVLIVGASGGVNTASIQIARLLGATVYVVGSGPEKLALAESLGAHLIDRPRMKIGPSIHPTGKRRTRVTMSAPPSRSASAPLPKAGAFLPWATLAGRNSRSITVSSSAGTCPSSARMAPGRISPA
jgi:D-arabinose 1-dehydrogenase-like Zn-dependent alcohol dehydrogenase